VANGTPSDGAPAVRIGVLASGSGTIFEAILGSGLPVGMVLADRPCRALDVAAGAGIDAVLVDRSAFGGYGQEFRRAEYTVAVTAELESAAVDVVVMAGYGTVLGQAIHDAFPGRILNTHPALLPAFPGWHAVEEALASGTTETGTTVHLATLEMDAGPILAQQAVPIHPGDTVATLHERIKEVERTLYPATIRVFVDRLAVQVHDEPTSSMEVRQ
jgi:phosphoribosylglycinamide formyltransferase-1